MLEDLHGVPNRIAALQRKLAARAGKPEYKENCKAIRTEIARLERVTANKPALDAFIAESAAVASDPGEE